MSEDTITIPVSEYYELINNQKWLWALEEAGVDNWEGIHYAYELRDINDE